MSESEEKLRESRRFWEVLPVGAWFPMDDPRCENRYSVQERTGSGCRIVCSTPYNSEWAKRNLEEIVKLHNGAAEPNGTLPQLKHWNNPLPPEFSIEPFKPSSSTLSPTRIQEFWDAQAAWSQATFGADSERDHIGPLKHLAKEAVEAQVRPSDPVEIADCLFLVFDAARRSGLTLAKLIETAENKLEVNKARKWQKPTDDNPVEHVRESAQTRSGRTLSAQQFWPKFENKFPATYTPGQYQDIMEFSEALSSYNTAELERKNELLIQTIEAQRKELAECDKLFEKLRRDSEMLRYGCIVEIAVENQSVADYVKHWEGRAEAAEAELLRLRGKPLQGDDLDSYMNAPSHGPLHAEWVDKPHRLIYDLVTKLRAERSAVPQPLLGIDRTDDWEERQDAKRQVPQPPAKENP